MPRKKIERVLPEGEKIEWTLIKEDARPHIEKLIEVYKINPHNARVKFFNSKQDLSYRRLVIFELGKNDFEITSFKVTYGISVTNRMYHHQKKEQSITYKKGKFYYINKTRGVNSLIMPLTLDLLCMFIGETEGINSRYFIPSKVPDTVNKIAFEAVAPPLNGRSSRVFDFIVKRFNWVKTLSEHPLGGSLNFNRVKSDKLFNFKEINRFYYKVPNNIAQIVLDSKWSDRLHLPVKKHSRLWQDVLKYLDNVQNLTPEFINSNYFNDTCKMARTLGRKINCSWGEKRLKEEHDKWSREITNIILDCELEYDLAIKPTFKAFSEFSGFKLLSTNKEMLTEGIAQDHCVGTYIDQVNNGSCAIYHIEGYTLQVSIENKKTYTGYDPNTLEPIICLQGQEFIKTFKINQFKGYKNCEAPRDLYDRVQIAFEKFKEEGLFEKVTDEGWKPKITKDSRDARYDAHNAF